MQLVPPSPPATAPQQEADTEASTETLNKSSQGSSSGTPAAASETAGASKEKETSAEKSKDSGSVSVCTRLASGSNPWGQAGSQDLSPCLPPPGHPHCRGVCLSSEWGGRAAGGGDGLSRVPFHRWACGPGQRSTEPTLPSV